MKKATDIDRDTHTESMEKSKRTHFGEKWSLFAICCAVCLSEVRIITIRSAYGWRMHTNNAPSLSVSFSLSLSVCWSYLLLLFCYYHFLRFVLLLLKFQTFCFALRLINISLRSCIADCEEREKKKKHTPTFYSSFSRSISGCVRFFLRVSFVLYSQYIPHLIFSSFLHLLSIVGAVAASLLLLSFGIFVHEFTLSVLCAIPIQFRFWLICAWFWDFQSSDRMSGALQKKTPKL